MIKPPVEIIECSISEISSADQQLIYAAKKSASDAYAPYSQFKVGAAVRMENGKILSANNQENAAYPSGLCAERVALFFSSARYPRQRIKAIATTHVPCGGCRQVILEYERKQNSCIRIIMLKNKNTALISEGISHLLPLSFTRKELKKV